MGPKSFAIACLAALFWLGAAVSANTVLKHENFTLADCKGEPEYVMYEELGCFSAGEDASTEKTCGHTTLFNEPGCKGRKVMSIKHECINVPGGYSYRVSCASGDFLKVTSVYDSTGSCNGTSLPNGAETLSSVFLPGECFTYQSQGSAQVIDFNGTSGLLQVYPGSVECRLDPFGDVNITLGVCFLSPTDNSPSIITIAASTQAFLAASTMMILALANILILY